MFWWLYDESCIQRRNRVINWLVNHGEGIEWSIDQPMILGTNKILVFEEGSDWKICQKYDEHQKNYKKNDEGRE